MKHSTLNRSAAWSLCAMVLIALSLFGGSAPSALLEIGSQKQVFVDEFVIQSLADARQVLNVGVKEPGNPVIKPDRPWEGALLSVSFVTYDEKEALFKMWYSTSSQWKAERGGKMTDYRWESGATVRETVPASFSYAGDYHQYTSRTCYAVSRDGAHWQKPDLGKVEFNGSKQNNILPAGSFVPAYLDTHESDPSRRYKALRMRGSTTARGMQLDLYYSPDGFQWTPYEKNPVLDTTPEPGRWGPTTYMGWDPIRKVYAAHIENCQHRRCPIGMRIIARAESPDLTRWSNPQSILLPDEKDFPDTEFYALQVTPYHGLYLGLLWNFRTTNTLHYPELVTSRDGYHYERNFREPLIRLGDHGRFDEASVYTSAAIFHSGKAWIYYTGANWRGPQQLYEQGESALRAVGLATLPEDGFVSVDAGKLRPGILTTRPLTFKGRELYVSMEAAKHNDGAGRPEVKVEIWDHQHRAVPGFGLAEADGLTGSGRHEVKWQNRSDVGSLQGRPVQLRFHIRNAKLYSFQFEGVGP